VVCYFRDISDQIRAREILRESQNQLRALTDTLEAQVHVMTELEQQSELLRELSQTLMQAQDDERRRIPIPPIYFGKVAEGRLEVIDGQQRLTTLVNFVSNKFPLRKLHRMSSLNHKFFKDLPRPTSVLGNFNTEFVQEIAVVVG
jgi:hypothetical protein